MNAGAGGKDEIMLLGGKNKLLLKGCSVY